MALVSPRSTIDIHMCSMVVYNNAGNTKHSYTNSKVLYDLLVIYSGYVIGYML